MAGFATDANEAEGAWRCCPSPPREAGRCTESKGCQPGSPSPASLDDERTGLPQTPKMTATEFMEKECGSLQRCLEKPIGWPRLAAMPDYFNNMDVLRSFNSVALRLIHYHGARLAFLAKHLDAFDKERNEHARSLTKYQKRLPGDSIIKGDCDILITEMEEEYLAYTKLTRRCNEMHQLHSVPRPLFKDVLCYILKNNMLDKDALVWMDAPHEAVSISTPLTDSMAFLTHTRVGKCLIWLLPVPEGTDPDERFIQHIVLVIVQKVFITLGALAVLVPIGIMFLCDLSKAQSFGVVVGFSVLFSLSISLTQEVDSHKAWLVVCAFTAVLVTVMVQLVGTIPGK